MSRARSARPPLPAALLVVGAALVHCSSSSGNAGGDAGACFSDSDGINGGTYTFDLTVDDTGFSKTILATQNDSQVTITLKNTGTKPHGFEVGCTSVATAYPDLPAGCPAKACFPASSTIAPIAPGATATITFDTPTPDSLIYPFGSSEPGDGAVPGLNSGQWTLM